MTKHLTRWAGAAGLTLALMVGLAGSAQAQKHHAEADTAHQALQTVDQVIEVRMASFRYHPDTLRIPSGKTVKLVFRNKGNFPHEFMAGREVTEEMHGYKHSLFEGVEVRKSKAGEHHHGEGHEAHGEEGGHGKKEKHEHGKKETHEGEKQSHRKEHGGHGTMIKVKPDSTQSLTFRLPASKKGQWEMGCFLTNPALHYKAGMKGTVLVQ